MASSTLRLFMLLVLAPVTVHAQFTDVTGKFKAILAGQGGGAAPAVGPTKTVAPPAAPAPAAQADEGPAAVIAYEKSLRGVKDDKAYDPYDRYPKAATPDMDKMKNIITMNQTLWTPAQLEADLKKTAVPGQKAILVMVKTEFCHTNPWRLCTVTTAALEKRSTPALRQVRVYGAWVKGNPDHQTREWRQWEDKVIDAYKFEQGPGAKLVLLAPGKGVVAESHALELKLISQELEKDGGRTPALEAWLNAGLAKIP